MKVFFLILLQSKHNEFKISPNILVLCIIFLVGLRSGEWAINSQTRNTTPMEQNNLTFSPWKVERSSTGQLTITPTSVQTRLKGPKPLLLSYRQPNLPCCLLQHLNRSIKKT
jgi:hypothetical protein